MRVYVIRHGESETNQAGQWTGWLDVALTEKGREDAAKAGAYLKNISFDKIYSSDLVRARETAEIVIPGCQYVAVECLREINIGSFAGEPISALTEEQRQHVLENGYFDFGGETRKEFSERVLGFMKSLEEFTCENIAVFSHAGLLREMLDIVLGARMPRKQVCCNNCTIAVFEYTDEIWKLHSWINLT